MAVTLASFRSVFPEFGDVEKYPDPAVSFWLDQAGVTLPQAFPATQVDWATMLFIAHNLTLGTLSATGSGGAASFAPVTVTSAGAGIWNATAYGQRFYALLRGLVSGGFYRPSARASTIAAAQGFPYRRP